MPVYAYKGVDISGAAAHGTLAADTPAAARRSLHARRIQVLECDPVTLTRRELSSYLPQRRRDDIVAGFARQLAMLLRVGEPVVDALDVLLQQPHRRFVPVLRDVRECVASGASLSDALERHPHWFDTVFVSAARVGQMSGRLDQALGDVAEYLRARQQLRSKVFTALAYPALLAIVGAGVVSFLMTYVVPQLVTVLEGTGQSLPASTAILKAISDFIMQNAWGIIVALAGSAAAVVVAFRYSRFRRTYQRLLLAIPVIGELLRKSVVARFAQTMSLMLRSGVAFLEALSVQRHCERNLVLAGELEIMQSAIQRGSDIAPALGSSAVFPPLVTHMFHVGQRSGELPEMLKELQTAYATEVRLAVAKATAVLEPLLIIVMSAVVGFIVFATMMPILQATKVM